MVITQKDVTEKFAFPKPTNGNVLVEFSEKEVEVKVGKLILDTKDVEGYKTYLIVVDNGGLDYLKAGDLIEITGHSVVAFHYGEDRKKFGLVHESNIACIYSSLS